MLATQMNSLSLQYAALQEKLNQLEAELQQWRNQMVLGWTDKAGQVHKASSVQLRNTMRTHANEDVRKACWEVSSQPTSSLRLSLL